MKNLIAILSIMTVSVASGQVLVNSGAYIAIDNGAYVQFQEVKNNSGSTIVIGGGLTEVAGTLTNAGSVVVDGSLTASGNIVNDGDFVISDSGSMLDNGNVSGSKPFKVRKDILGNGPKYLSSPVSGELAHVFNGAFLYEYNETNSKWVPITDASENVDVLSGYSAQFAKNVTLEFEGTTNAGNITKSLGNTGDGWNLLGNPYPSAFDWINASIVKTNIGNAIYLWNASNQNYSTYLGSSSQAGVQVNVVNGSDASIIPKMQAFFVKASGLNPSIEVSNDARIHSGKEIAGNERKLETPESYVKLVLTAQSGRYDEMAIRLHPMASSAFDPQLDAYKLLTVNTEVPQLFALDANKDPMAIHSIGWKSEAVIPLGFENVNAGQFTIEVVESTLPTQELILVDHLESKNISLLTEAYTFSGSAQSLAGRFELMLVSSITGNKTFETFRVSNLENGLLFSGMTVSDENVGLKIMDLNGKLIHQEDMSFVKGERKIFIPDFATGIYIYELRYNQQTYTGKLKIK